MSRLTGIYVEPRGHETTISALLPNGTKDVFDSYKESVNFDTRFVTYKVDILPDDTVETAQKRFDAVYEKVQNIRREFEHKYSLLLPELKEIAEKFNDMTFPSIEARTALFELPYVPIVLTHGSTLVVDIVVPPDYPVPDLFGRYEDSGSHVYRAHIGYPDCNCDSSGRLKLARPNDVVEKLRTVIGSVVMYKERYLYDHAKGVEIANRIREEALLDYTYRKFFWVCIGGAGHIINISYEVPLLEVPNPDFALPGYKATLYSTGVLYEKDIIVSEDDNLDTVLWQYKQERSRIDALHDKYKREYAYHREIARKLYRDMRDYVRTHFSDVDFLYWPFITRSGPVITASWRESVDEEEDAIRFYHSASITKDKKVQFKSIKKRLKRLATDNQHYAEKYGKQCAIVKALTAEYSRREREEND